MHINGALGHKHLLEDCMANGQVGTSAVMLQLHAFSICLHCMLIHPTQLLIIFGS